jgi:Ca2+-binding RTX toxin-like protein
MAHFLFQQNAANGGNGTELSPWNQAGLDAAIASGSFVVGGADALIILNGGSNTVQLAAAAASGTVVVSVTGGVAWLSLQSPVLQQPGTVDLTAVGQGIRLANPLVMVPQLGTTLRLTAAVADGLTAIGYGTVAVTNLQATPGANLSGITTLGLTATAALAGSLVFTGDLGQAAVSLGGSGSLRVNSSGLQRATTTVQTGVTLSTTPGAITQLSGARIGTSGSGAIELADLNSGAITTDLSGLSGTIVAVVRSNQTFQGNLGTVPVQVHKDATLTLNAAAAQWSNALFSGEGKISYAAAATGSNEAINALTTGANTLDYRLKTAAARVVVNTGSGADVVTTGLSNDTVTTGAGNDTLVLTGNGAGTGGNDILALGAGHDRLLSGAVANDGNNVIQAGGGNDTIDLAWGGVIALGDNFITDSGGADSIVAGSGNDTILSGDSDDTILGGAGADSMGAGAGNDRLLFGNGEFEAADTITGGGGVNAIRLLADGQTISDAAFANKTRLQSFTTANGPNVITFGANAMALGLVSITGGSGADTLNAAVQTTALTILGGDGDDQITAGSAADSIDCGDGNDVVNANSGNDTVIAGNGNDVVLGNEGEDWIDVGAGNDNVQAGKGDDTVYGGLGNDELDGGSTGDDWIFGGDGNDLITGGVGVDRLTGDAGADDFKMSNIVADDGSLGVDLITDFSLAQTDQIGQYSILNLERLALLERLVQVADTTAPTVAGAVVTAVAATIGTAYNMATAGAGANLLLIGGNYSNASAVQAALRANVSNGTTAMAANAGFLVAYDNGSYSTIALVTTALAVAAGNLMTGAVVTDLTTVYGVTDATTLTSAAAAWLFFLA